MAERKPPLLLRGALTGRVYVVTSYTDHGDGRITAKTKHDVTEQYNALRAEDRPTMPDLPGRSPSRCPIPTPPGYGPCRKERGHAGLHDFPTAAEVVDELQRRIQRTVEYLSDVVAATEDPTVLMVSDAVVASLTTPAREQT